MDLLVSLLERPPSTRPAGTEAGTFRTLGDIQDAFSCCISFVNQSSNTSGHNGTRKVRSFTGNYRRPKAASVGDPFLKELLWTRSWHHYSPAYQWRGSTRRAPCRNKEAGEEASAFPHPCRDEPPTGNTESSARLIMSSTNQTGQTSWYWGRSASPTKVNWAIIQSPNLCCITSELHHPGRRILCWKLFDFVSSHFLFFFIIIIIQW